jgi:hypothetical protein
VRYWRGHLSGQGLAVEIQGNEKEQGQEGGKPYQEPDKYTLISVIEQWQTSQCGRFGRGGKNGD